MNSFTIQLSGNKSSGEVTLPRIYLKGETFITFDFTNIGLDGTSISRIHLDYGDGSAEEVISYKLHNDHINDPITYNFALYNTFFATPSAGHVFNFNRGFVAGELSESADFNRRTMTIQITFSDYSVSKWIIPYDTYKGSYYDALGELSVITSQLTDTSENNVYCVVETEDGAVINIVLS